MSLLHRWTALMILLLSCLGAQSLSEESGLRRLAEKECGPGNWIVPLKEFKELSRKRSPKRYCYRTGRLQSATWVDAFHECRRTDSELVWVSGFEEAKWLIDVLHSYAVDRSKPDWFNPQKGWMVNAHRYLYSERYGEGARWKDGLFVQRPLNVSNEVHDSSNVFKLTGTVQNSCEHSALASSIVNQSDSPGDCFSLFTDRLISVPCKQVFEEEFGYVCKKAYGDPAANVSTCIDRCPAGWSEHTLEGQSFCYYVGAFTGTPITWYEALNQCRLLGMELWAPRSAMETVFLNSVLTNDYFSKANSYWWVNAHSQLYTNSNANGSLSPASETGLYWPDGWPMGRRAAGDGFSVKHFELKLGDYCGAAHTLFTQNDNMVANVSSCMCRNSFGYLCRAPICTSSERARKQQYHQSLEERDADQGAFIRLLSIFSIVLLCFVFLLLFALSYALWILCCRKPSQREPSQREAQPCKPPANKKKNENSNDGNNIILEAPLLQVPHHFPETVMWRQPLELARDNPTGQNKSPTGSMIAQQSAERVQSLNEESKSDDIDLNKVSSAHSE